MKIILTKNIFNPNKPKGTMKNAWKPLLLFLFLGSFPLAVDAQIITTVAGTGTAGYSGNGGLATSAQMDGITSVVVDAAGNLYISDYYNNVIRRVDAVTGIMTTIAGNTVAGYSGDGGLATSAELNRPAGLVLDGLGNLYFADSANSVVRKINLTTGIITTLVGTGVGGYTGDGGPATSAQLYFPADVTLDPAGNLYIADGGNDVVRRVDRITGIITTFAGTGTVGFSGDGGLATGAQLGGPDALKFDAAGNLYIADTGNYRIRRIDRVTGVITTVVGNGIVGYTGDGGPATSASFNYPGAVVFDSAGNMFITDEVNSVIRRVDAITGIVTTVVGNGTVGYSGDGGPPLSASLQHPEAMFIDAAGNFYIADGLNNVVRKVTNLVVAYTPTITPTPTNTYTPTMTFTGTITVTPTFTWTSTFTNTFTFTLTPPFTFTPTYTPTFTYTPTITPTFTNTLPPGTNTYTPVPTNTFTYSFTPTYTYTPTLSPTFTQTFTLTPTFTYTEIPGTNTFTPAPTKTFTYTSTATYTYTSTYTPTFTQTFTTTPTYTNTLPSGTDTFTPVPTNSFTPSYTPTFTYTPTPSYTSTITYTPTITATPTITSTPTNTPTATPNFDIFYVDKNLWTPSKDGPVSMYVGYSKYGGEYSFRIYNTAGEHIKTLDAYRPTQPITKSYTWDGKNKNGDDCASGVYILYLIEPFDRKVKRLILVK